jgi:Lecithin retinol acyltransferase
MASNLTDFECTCENELFGCYYSADECLGLYCKKCWKEWLLLEFAGKDVDSVVEHDGKTYYSTVIPHHGGPCESPMLQVTSSREEIIPQYVAESVKPGDQVMWRRPWVVWHHAIVEEVNGCEVKLIHFAKEGKQIVIHRETIDARNEFGQMYLVVYNEAVRRCNPSELVLARARGLLGTTGYQLLSRNCENFATFCKTGVSVNLQRQWFLNKLEEIGKCIWNTASAKITSSLIKVTEFCCCRCYTINFICNNRTVW